MPTDWPRYPSRDQFVEYLTSYCAHHHLEPNYDQRIIRLERLGTGWRARSASEEWHARHVVLATGANRRAVRPIWPGMESFSGEILHSRDYRNGDPWKGRSVLAIGFGNSACEIAIDLAERGARPHLAVRSPVNVIPRDVFRLVPVLQLAIAMRHLPAAVADAFRGQSSTSPSATSARSAFASFRTDPTVR
jgi:cation diffusion facilitator CzcD-associated flavoprotein CzcO